MKRSLMGSVLMIALLAGCAGPARRERFETLRAPIAAAERLTVETTLTARWDRRLESYRLRCEYDAGAWDVTVTAPELLAEVTAHLDGPDSALRYDEVILPVPDLTAAGLSPATVVPAVLDALRTGAVDSLWDAEGDLAVKLILRDDTDVTVFFAPDGAPRRAELAENGLVRAVCGIESLTTGDS